MIKKVKSMLFKKQSTKDLERLFKRASKGGY